MSTNNLDLVSMSVCISAQTKMAAKALSEVFFYGPPRAEGWPLEGIRFNTISDPVGYLMKAGLRQTQEHINTDLKTVSERCRALSEIADFFGGHPTADHVCAADFDEGSAAKAFLLDPEAEWADEGEAELGLTPQEALSELAHQQRRKVELIKVKRSAMQEAL